MLQRCFHVITCHPYVNWCRDHVRKWTPSALRSGGSKVIRRYCAEGGRSLGTRLGSSATRQALDEYIYAYVRIRVRTHARTYTHCCARHSLAGRETTAPDSLAEPIYLEIGIWKFEIGNWKGNLEIGMSPIGHRSI